MFQRSQIFRTQFALGLLVPQKVGPVLCGPYPGSTGAFNASEIAVGHHLHEDESVLAILVCSGSERATFLLDPHSNATRELLCTALGQSRWYFALAGLEDNFIGVPVNPIFWTDALLELDAHRESHPGRHPRDFIAAATCVNLIAEHAIHPNDPTRLARPIPGSASVTVLLAPEHLPYLGSASSTP